MKQRTVVFGPPGTGKTTFLLEAMEKELARGTPPDRIAFVSFTRNAVAEAKMRAAKKFGVSGKELRWFRTLHSLSFAALGLTREMILADLNEFAVDNGFSFGKKNSAIEGGVLSANNDDRLIHAYSLSRAMELPLNEVCRRFRIQNISASRYETFQQRLAAWKRERRLYDWSDMIDEFIKINSPIDVDVAFVDEAQDLTPQQWRMVNVAFRDTPIVTIAGDDDQAIYEWSGADVNNLLKIEGKQIILNKSHRVPAKLRDVALSIAGRIRNRREKDWAPSDRAGELLRAGKIASLPLTNGEDWLLLARTSYSLPSMRRELEGMGVAYVVDGESSISSTDRANYKTYKALCRGEMIPASDARKLLAVSSMSINLPRSGVIGADRIPMDERALFKKWKPEHLRYVSRCDANEQLIDAPKISLSTIHGAKGSEATNVALSLDMTHAPSLALRFKEFADAEHRVWYVAATRSRDRLVLLRNTSEFPYNFGMTHVTC